MANNIIPITVEALPAYHGLNGEDADNYYMANQRKAFLGAQVINPFSDALKEKTGYSDRKIPHKPLEKPIMIGDFRFVAQVTPTTKRPGYKEIFDELDGYLRARLAEYKAGNRPVGVFTIDGEPYVSAHDVLRSLKKAKSRVTSEGVKIGITDPEHNGTPGSVVVPLGMDLEQLTEGNAARYLDAEFLSGEFAEFIEGFEGELLGLTGFGDGHPPSQTEHMYRQMGSHIFHVASVPYASTSYGKIVDTLDKEPGKNPEIGGDLVLVTMDVDIPRLKVYDPRRRDDDCLVKLKALLNRMDRLVEDNTETKLRQRPINHYPVV